MASFRRRFLTVGNPARRLVRPGCLFCIPPSQCVISHACHEVRFRETLVRSRGSSGPQFETRFIHDAWPEHDRHFTSNADQELQSSELKGNFPASSDSRRSGEEISLAESGREKSTAAGVELQMQSSSFENGTFGGKGASTTAFSRQAVVRSGRRSHQNYDSQQQKEHPPDSPHFS